MDMILLTTSEGKQRLQENLEFVSASLTAVDILDDAGSAHLQKLGEIKGALDKTIDVLSFPETAIKNIGAAIEISYAISDLRGDIRSNPQRSAKAFGRIFAGLAVFSQYMPFPVSMYFSIFEGAEDFFENLRIQMQPEIHMREPGLREVIDNL
ncbi:MAG TPA: hypothetical protein PLD38_06985 [Pyrinomonadaceae bacterium]|nr:hypothetical protein [Chloracidobacterium sp.]MBL0240033.1 hypothetical protein [Chloracidobacterium sp.]MBP9934509.1 hypothetical protein [Pyrinomonadaceae bacterium]HQY67009.1 hypothetical protein [Pyrinomonadaceae bacterium]HRA41840.1 hypothetical protein [Pyrinomonadaceae bacterium]